MPILHLIFLIFALFLVLWVSDLFFTISCIKKVGKNVEINPFIRLVMSTRSRFIWLFKFLEILVFSYLIWYVSNLNEELGFSLLLGVISVYSLVVLMGLKVFIDLTGKSTPVVLLFFVICVSLLLFIQLNHLEYRNKTTVSNALSECNSNYANCYTSCNSNSTTSYEDRQQLTNSLNLTINQVI